MQVSGCAFPKPETPAHRQDSMLYSTHDGQKHSFVVSPAGPSTAIESLARRPKVAKLFQVEYRVVDCKHVQRGHQDEEQKADNILWTYVSWGQKGMAAVDVPVGTGQSMQTRQLVASTAQEFVDAVRSLPQGIATIINIPSGAVVNLTDAVTLNPLTVDEIQTGSLTIRGGVNGTSPSVLHLGWRAGVSAALGSSVPLVLENLILDGTCYEYTVINPEAGLGWFTADLLQFFPRNLPSALASILVRVRGTNVTWRSGEYDALFRAFPWYRVYNTFPLQSWMLNVVMASTGPNEQLVEKVNEDGIWLSHYSDPSSDVNGYNRIIGDSPSDPVPQLVPGSKFMPRVCKNAEVPGPLVPPAALALNETLLMIWAASTSASLNTALISAEAAMAWRVSDPTFISFPGAIHIAGDIMYAHGDRKTPLQLPGILALLGPQILPQEKARLVTLDFQASPTPVLELPVLPRHNFTSYLLINQLVLKGLAAAPITPLLAPTSAADLTAPGLITASALPLWAFASDLRALSTNSQASASTPAQVQLNNVTLVLPQSDFAALLAAVLRGPGSWKTGAVHTRALMAGIQYLQVGAMTSNLLTANPCLQLEAYKGWGVEAKLLILVPESPLPTCTALPEWDLPYTGCGKAGPKLDQNDHNGRDMYPMELRVGLGVGIGVGLPLLLVGIGGLTLVLVRSRRQQEEAAVQKKVHGAEPDRAAAGKDDLTPPDPMTSQLQISMPAPDKKGWDLGRLLLHAASKGGSDTTAPMLAAAAGDAEDGLATALSQAPLSTVGDMSALKAALVAVRVLQESHHAGRQLGEGDADALELREVLGVGSCGTVYRGKWRGLQVAVKTLVFSEGTAFEAGKPMPYERAVTEAAVAVSLNHRNIVATYRYDIKEVTEVQEDGQSLQVVVDGTKHTSRQKLYKLFLVQEFCLICLRAAMAAKALHRADGSVCTRLVIVLMIDVVTGLIELHAKNIVHGDLKPDNILLKADKSVPAQMVAKVTDFGLSVALDPNATHISNYKSGTPFYVAPEVLSTMRLSTASDIYALGIVIWEAFTNRRPYLAIPGEALMANTTFFYRPPDPQDLNLYQLVLKCAHQDPTQRPSASAVREELISILAARGVTIPAAPVPVMEQ